MKHTIRTITKQEKGNALLMVIILILVMMLLAGALMSITFSQMEISQAYKKSSNVYYAAQSGAEKAVDMINKEIRANKIEMIRKASEYAKKKAIEEFDQDSLEYQISSYNENDEKYKGEYFFSNEQYDEKHSNLKYDYYQEYLRKLVYDKVVETFYEDMNKNNPILHYMTKSDGGQVDVKVWLDDCIQYNNDDTELHFFTVSDDQPWFLVKAQAAVIKEDSTFAYKMVVEGKIFISDWLDENNQKERFLEEYEWKNEKKLPNAFRSPILTFGDMVIKSPNITIRGDVRTKGYVPNKFAPDSDEYGGIYVVGNGSSLEVEGNVYTLANIHTIRPYNEPASKKKKSQGETKIHITKDVIASTVSIDDNHYIEGREVVNHQPWIAEKQTQYYNINIDGDAYMDNDIRVDRYVNNCKIRIKGSCFGVMHEDPNPNSVYGPNPNKSSGIFAQGKENTISIGGNVFVHGNPFIDFGDGNGFHPLYESIGAPFDDVYDLKAYRNSDDPHGGTDEYITNSKNDINCKKILINNENFKGYAPYWISAKVGNNKEEPVKLKAPNRNLTKWVFNEEGANYLFNRGFSKTMIYSTSPGEEDLLEINPRWKNKWIDSTTRAKSIIFNAFSYLTGTNDFKRNYFKRALTQDEYNDLKYYKGIQGYMFVKRDIFYKALDPDDIWHPEMMEFDSDIVNKQIKLDLLEKWSEDSPICIFNTQETGEKVVDISDYYNDDNPVETVIIDKGLGTLTLKASDLNKNEFHGFIVSSGKVKFTGNNPMQFTGIVISKGKNEIPNREDLMKGTYAGIVFEQRVTMDYDPDILFKWRTKNREIKRKILDYMHLTDYTKGDIIGSDGILQDTVKFSQDSTLDVINMGNGRDIYFKMGTLKHIN